MDILKRQSRTTYVLAAQPKRQPMKSVRDSTCGTLRCSGGGCAAGTGGLSRWGEPADSVRAYACSFQMHRPRVGLGALGALHLPESRCRQPPP